MTSKIAVITYKNKQSGNESEVRMEVVDEKHAKQVAKKLRPRHAKLVSIRLEYKVNLVWDMY